MKAMILAAGLGTRLKPLTERVPKALIRVGEYTMLERAVKYLKKYNVNEIVINVHHHAEQILAYVKEHREFGLNVCFSDERCQLLNTGGALVHASNFLKGDEPFILMAVDVFTDLDLNSMLHFHSERNSLATLAVKKRETTRSLLFDSDMSLIGWRNNKTKESKGRSIHQAACALGFSGIHIIDPLIFSLIIEEGAFSIIDLYLRLMNDHKISGYRHDEDKWLEFGRMDNLQNQVQSEDFLLLTKSLE